MSTFNKWKDTDQLKWATLEFQNWTINFKCITQIDFSFVDIFKDIYWKMLAQMS